MTEPRIHGVEGDERICFPEFCGAKLAETGPPCILPAGHRGLHVPATHKDVGPAIRVAWLGAVAPRNQSAQTLGDKP